MCAQPSQRYAHNTFFFSKSNLIYGLILFFFFSSATSSTTTFDCILSFQNSSQNITVTPKKKKKMLRNQAYRNLSRAIPCQAQITRQLFQYQPVLLSGLRRQYASASTHPATDPPTAEELKNNHDYFFDKDGKRRVTVDFEYPGMIYFMVVLFLSLYWTGQYIVHDS